MNDGMTWQPSHRRSVESGKVADHWTENGERANGVTMPPEAFFDDTSIRSPETEPEVPNTDRVQLLREVFTVLETGEPHRMAARLQALKMIHGISGLSIRQAAQKADCPFTTFDRIRRRMEHLFQR